MGTIEGYPTKQFFIEMITRDISIEDAIIDLLDNSIDGISRTYHNDYNGRWIHINISADCFEIIDNCGGFSLDTAIKYAFRFGRPATAPHENNTIGRFGIGMKRSLFKIGKHFTVESETDKERFTVDVDVDKWSRNKLDGDAVALGDDWSFSYDTLAPTGVAGTRIKVDLLNDDVKVVFSDDLALERISDYIQRLLTFSFHKGLSIQFNGVELEGRKTELLFSGYKLYYSIGAVGDVRYRIIAGLGESGKLDEAGWYIYCNNRLVLEADKTIITGWGDETTPKWHNDYSMFRGLVFLDSEDTIKLPLTTTKKGIDTTSKVYKRALYDMEEAAKAVFVFLKNVAKLGDKASDYREQLYANMEKRNAMDLKDYAFEYEPEFFVAPVIDEDLIAQKQDTVRISFVANKLKADSARKHADANSYKELGEKMLEYYLYMEDIEDEE